MQQGHPMKDVTPKKAKAETPPITEGMTRKGGRNQGPSKIKERPAAPAPITPKSKAVAVHQPKADPPQPKSMLQIIAEAVVTPGFDKDSMRALLDMQKEIVAEERKQSFDAAFIALQSELPVINKDGKIEIRKDGRLLQSTPYATFENIMDVVQPFLTKHGFGLSFETQSSGDRLLVRGHLIGHGHERHTEFPLPAEASGSKNNVQGWGSSLSYGKRYCTIALLNIRSRALQDADTDGFPGDFQRSKGGGLTEAVPKPEVLTDIEARDLRELMDECGVDTSTLCRHFGIDKVADLPRRLLTTAAKDCRDYRANREAKQRHG
jgi:hypothetical protein